jgi:hypothetical protein
MTEVKQKQILPPRGKTSFQEVKSENSYPETFRKLTIRIYVSKYKTQLMEETIPQFSGIQVDLQETTMLLSHADDSLWHDSH